MNVLHRQRYLFTYTLSLDYFCFLLLFLTSVPLGICAWLRFCQKQKASERSQPENPKYDVVKLKREPVVMHNNDAYGVH